MSSALAVLVATWLDAGLATGTLLALRHLPVVLLVPLFGGMRVPAPVRLAMLAVLVLVSWPAALPALPEHPAVWVAVGASQLVVGLATAAALLAAIEVFRMLGALSDTVLGRGSFGAGDPLQPDPDSPLGQLHALLALVVLFAADAHLVVAESLRRGVERFGPAQTLSGAQLDAVGANTIAVVHTALETAVALAAPAFVAALLVDLLLGWAQRGLPQVQAMFLAMPLRQLVGWTLVAAVATAALPDLVAAVPSAVGALDAALGP